jgi:hypothetical protein
MTWCSSLLFIAVTASAQTLTGVVDIHVHSDPDSMPRSIDAIDAAKLARSRGMRALVLKNHYESTASLAYLVRKEVPGIEIFGGIALNRTVGGVNPAAVERMPRVKGGWGRVVWMPTFDAENQVRFSKENRPFVSVSKNGQLLPEVKEVLALIAKNKLTLATGHSSPQEDLMLIRAAKDLGVSRIVVTHAVQPPVKMTVEQMKQAAAMGAYLEFVYNALIGPNKTFQMPEYAALIRAVGPEHCILSSDLGQAGNPLHPDGLEAFFRGLRGQGFSVAEIDRMSKTNPAKLLGLE